MKLKRSLLLGTLVLASGGACGNRLLVGMDPDAGPPSGAAGMTGAAGVIAETAGTTGAGGAAGVIGETAGTTGIAGVTGAAAATGAAGAAGSGTATQIVTPLRISGMEAVYRLAAVIWKDLPSDDLNSQAQLGVFKNTDDLHGAVRQLLADPRARKGVGAFYRWWLDLDRLANVQKDPNLFPQFNATLAHDMASETETFGVNITLDPNGTYQTLLTAPYSFINQRLSTIYGVAGITGEELQRAELDTRQRAGLLTQPALQALGSLAQRNSPSQRGKYISQRFFCQQVPAPPANVPRPADPLPAGTTMRAYLASHTGAEASCAACHSMLDQPGLAFETFDAIGRWRTIDNGAPVDVSGLKIYQLPGPPMVNGPIALASLVANTGQTQDCMVRYWLQYALGRDLTSSDEASVQQAAAASRAAGFNLKELIFSVLTTDSFLAP